ncbi:hypothetical protein [Erythrobacter sp.]|uniref:hypothetical protein n=1 Tax=Erythrobacter sp. TaxID=1042 RepID=UPI0025BA2874|nr:hypothetical protein [Erythrobacter sp.]
MGDALSDYDCARECSLAFLGRAEGAAHPFPSRTEVVANLRAFFAGDVRRAAGLTTKAA